LYNLGTARSTTFDDGSPVNDLAFSPDGATLVVAGEDGDLVFHNLDNAGTLTINDGSPVYSLAFSSNGKMLASGDFDGVVYTRPSALWSSSPDQLKAQLCHELRDGYMTQAQWTANIPDQHYQETCS
jgi:WD40 repeat protein